LLTEGTALIPGLYKSLPYDPEKDLVPISGLITINQGVVVNPALPANDVKALVALAKSKPEGLSYANFGAGGQLNMAMLSAVTGAKFVGVPYRGSAPAMNDVIAGHVPMMVVSVGLAAPQARAGKIKLLAVTGARRVPQLPEVPTVAEGGWPTFEAVFWFGLFAPGGTPADMVERLNGLTVKALAEPKTAETLDKQGIVARKTSAGQFKSFVEAESKKFAEIIDKAKIKLEN
jgi:tripartite-type tricarboxylate transporter receptor subunit TctC